MSESITANRYADALFQIGNEKNILDQLKNELEVVKEVFEHDKQLNTFLKHPGIDNEKKKQFIDKVFQGLSTEIVNTFKLLVERRRTEIISSMVDHFNQIFNDAKGIAVATVHSIRPLSTVEIKALEDSFSKRLKKTAVKFDQVIDPSVLGGLKIIVGNRVYDGSVAGKLRRIERRIAAVNK